MTNDDANQQAAQSLTTGEDTRKKRSLASSAAKPNKKREGGHVWSNIIVLAFCIAGLILTLQGKVRGDEHHFTVAFAAAIGISGGETLLNILLMILSGRCGGNDEEDGGKKCGTKCLAVIINLVYLIGCCVCFGLVVSALLTSQGVEHLEQHGCVDNFGCANIMAICAAIIYGIRVLLIAMCLPCIICAGICGCCICCAKAAGVERTLDGGESGQQQQQGEQQAQNSSL